MDVDYWLLYEHVYYLILLFVYIFTVQYCK
jgi:hypothetical protein